MEKHGSSTKDRLLNGHYGHQSAIIYSNIKTDRPVSAMATFPGLRVVYMFIHLFVYFWHEARRRGRGAYEGQYRVKDRLEHFFEKSYNGQDDGK